MESIRSYVRLSPWLALRSRRDEEERGSGNEGRKRTQRLIGQHSYNKYLSVAARVVRRSLKDDKRLAAERRGEMELKFAKWNVSAFILSHRLCLSMQLGGSLNDGGREGRSRGRAFKDGCGIDGRRRGEREGTTLGDWHVN